ncbi:MAG: hypothetical protein EXS51_04380 [Candidatus Taylorbacteria bacterium]|nr:hypothetical protein [Candidatus Taylorbacteria bacterium]
MTRRKKPSFKRGDRVVALKTVRALNRDIKVGPDEILTVMAPPRWHKGNWVIWVSRGLKFLVTAFQKLVPATIRMTRRIRRSRATQKTRFAFAV